jgi:hypothetical protein
MSYNRIIDRENGVQYYAYQIHQIESLISEHSMNRKDVYKSLNSIAYNELGTIDSAIQLLAEGLISKEEVELREARELDREIKSLSLESGMDYNDIVFFINTWAERGTLITSKGLKKLKELHIKSKENNE